MLKNNQKIYNRLINRQNVKVILHLMVWVIFIIIPHFVITRYWDDNNFIPWSFYLNTAFYGIIFYLNYLWLVPRFFFLKKKVFYFTGAFTIVLALYLVNLSLGDVIKLQELKHYQEMDRRDMPNDDFADFAPPFDDNAPDKPFPRDDRAPRFEPPNGRPEFKKGSPMDQMRHYSFALISIMVTGFGIGLRLIEQHAATEKKQRELEKEKLNSELAFLKNQISPHFFFNTLNNIYSLVEINTADAQRSILTLSKLMRYLLYESESGEVLLSREMEFMNNYINLMKLRLTNKVDIEVKFPEKFHDHKVPPLLFISFIENAFKHGISYREKSFVKIYLESDANKISFLSMNSIGKVRQVNTDSTHSGIGLSNIKKRLNLLYPNQHYLNIQESADTFTVTLEIELKNTKNDTNNNH